MRYRCVVGRASDRVSYGPRRHGLRYTGYANEWGFAIYRASHEDYEDSFLLTGLPFGPVEDALDTACGLYVNDPATWT